MDQYALEIMFSNANFRHSTIIFAIENTISNANGYMFVVCMRVFSCHPSHMCPEMQYTVKFLNFGCKKLCCKSPKIQTKRPNLKVFCQKHANGIANSEDPDQTEEQSDLGLHCLPRSICHYGSFCMVKRTYNSDLKFLDRQVFANSADPDQTA